MAYAKNKSLAFPLSRAKMLAVILYTGCDCNYDMCAAERDGDFDKWKWFSSLLDFAVWDLQEGKGGSVG